MTNKEIIRKVNDGFMKGDVNAIVQHVTDDVTWELPGVFFRRGKEEFGKEAINENWRPLVITHINEMEEGNLVAVEGTVETTMPTGEQLSLCFFDIYRMENGKIKEMRSYVLPKK
jgi:uncharacterized protein